MSDFEALRHGRRRLREFCTPHQVSVEFFASGGSFRLHEDEAPLGRRLRHITSTATCIDSLRDCPQVDAQQRTQWFAAEALRRKDWTSENSASIYCRCRALPFVIAHTPTFDPRLEKHLERILAQLESDDRIAIGEADPLEPKNTWYPPNAFHTFWTLEALQQYQRFSKYYRALDRRRGLAKSSNAMVIWAWQVLGSQIALHKAKSSALDTDQLAWSLATITRFPLAGLSQRTLRYRDLLKEAIACFFQTQDEAGMWPHYDPLFHYREAGNAYCYAFETLTVLLKNALSPNATLFRSLLCPYLPKLLKLVDFAEATKISLGQDARAVGWSSGHRTNMPLAESWTTAAVFQSMQALRQLVGIWTREASLEGLNQRAVGLSRDEARTELIRRGATWSRGETVGDQLLTMFVQPALMRERSSQADPDATPIDDREMRSAILFGPPGTSKTSLARSVAGAIGWDYVELHASHFVAAGLPNVQRTADELFTRLMELDHCVVLFDEIDELMREREKEHEAFGRFLTTSMLPKLAELWKQRRIIYFVATNHVGFFDAALVRSERFDALVFVPPPGFKAKKDQVVGLLTDLLPGAKIKITVTRSEIDRELSRLENQKGDADGELVDGQLLAKFVLLRWDQLSELAHSLLSERLRNGITISGTTLRSALRRIGDSRLKTNKAYRDFFADRGREVRDFGKDLVWRIEGPIPRSLRDAGFIVDGKWCVGSRDWLKSASSPVVPRFLSEGRIRFVLGRERLNT